MHVYQTTTNSPVIGSTPVNGGKKRKDKEGKRERVNCGIKGKG
jgi:hypothetical protein